MFRLTQIPWFFAVAALSLGPTMRGETPAPAANSLDAARRDLRELPATERHGDVLGKSSAFDSASLPALTIPTGDGLPSKPEPNAPPSPTWLQDALKQTDTERGQRRTVRDLTFDRDPTNTGFKPVQPSDPLAQFLGQWLAPRDLEMLRPDVKKAADQKMKGPLDLNTATTLDNMGLPMSQSELVPTSIMPVEKNPYLQEPTPQFAPTNSFAPISATSMQPNERLRGVNVLPVATAPSNSLNSPNSLKPVATQLEPVSAPPTAPIVDDRKYFPQLRRF